MRAATRKTFTLILGLLLTTASFPATAQTLKDSDVDEAIKSGLAKKSLSVNLSGAAAGTGQFHLTAMGPLGRIAAGAKEAADKSMPFTQDDVDDEMTSPFFTITAVPEKPAFAAGAGAVTPAAIYIVIKRKSGSVVQPLTIETFPQSWDNPNGEKLRGQGIVGTFNVANVPNEDSLVIVVTNSGQIETPVSREDLAKIR